MKQKSNQLSRLLEFCGKSRGLLSLSRVLSGVSAVFILVPFLCVYMAARELITVFAGSAADTSELLKWGICALI